jgi:hypothetical protein
MITPSPGCSLTIMGHCPIMDNGGVVCPASLHCPLWEVSVPCHKDVTSSFLSGIQGDCKVTAERMA